MENYDFVLNGVNVEIPKKTPNNVTKSNKCNQCDYASSRASHLRTHLKTHNGEKSNKCNQCDFASFQSSNLRTHLKIHSGEKSNKCNQCDFSSSYACNLRQHLKTHSGEKLNKCNQCDYASSRIDSLRTHLKTHSGGCRRFEEAENTQWRKVKQMQPVLLCIISCRQFKETLKNVWTLLRWRKRVQLM